MSATEEHRKTRKSESVGAAEEHRKTQKGGSVARASTPAPFFESVRCYFCGSTEYDDFITAEDDLGGTPGTFHFVRCTRCALAYQNPRVALDHVGAYYDDQYIAHRRKRDWGVLTPLFERAMNKLDADKDSIVSRYITLGADSQVLVALPRARLRSAPQPGNGATRPETGRPAGHRGPAAR